jgi:hypothetical protein
VGISKHSHIAARGYLKAWSLDGQVGVGWVNRDDGPPRLPLSHAAVRSGFCLDRDADGTTNDWLEKQMSRVEAPAIDILRRLEDDWPVDIKARAKLSEFLALQYLRSPAYRKWHAQALPGARDTVRKPEHTDELLDAVEAHLSEDRQRHLMIAGQMPMVGTFIANMRWTLLRCGSPRLITSDQPLVPVAAGPRQPISAVSPRGMSSIAEIRFAVTPQTLLLLTWQDDHTPETIVKMPYEAVRNHNTLVVAQADEQWFHHPSARPEYKRQDAQWPSIVSTLPGITGTPFDTARHQVVKAEALKAVEGEGPHAGELLVIEWQAAGARATPPAAGAPA